ncbi:MAG: hypothetical protein LAT68_01485 [Cyclobacteriaceae bacterium]|nr:hypothetical protein [Cyclobacteriaceae bacterium]MCH8514975.1 hypothetical protein [Cyclobacteriaceae bacterium]
MDLTQENEPLRKLFLAVYFNDVNQVMDFKRQYPHLYAKKHQVQVDPACPPFHISAITYFHKVILFNGT